MKETVCGQRGEPLWQSVATAVRSRAFVPALAVRALQRYICRRRNPAHIDTNSIQFLCQRWFRKHGTPADHHRPHRRSSEPCLQPTKALPSPTGTVAWNCPLTSRPSLGSTQHPPPTESTMRTDRLAETPQPLPQCWPLQAAARRRRQTLQTQQPRQES